MLDESASIDHFADPVENLYVNARSYSTEKGEILAGSHGYYVRTSAYDFLGHFIVLAFIVRQWNSCLHSLNPVIETSMYQILCFNILNVKSLYTRN